MSISTTPDVNAVNDSQELVPTSVKALDAEQVSNDDILPTSSAAKYFIRVRLNTNKARSYTVVTLTKTWYNMLMRHWEESFDQVEFLDPKGFENGKCYFVNSDKAGAIIRDLADYSSELSETSSSNYNIPCIKNAINLLTSKINLASAECFIELFDINPSDSKKLHTLK